MNIKFFIPHNEMIPTQLRLVVDDTIHVYYQRLTDKFGYMFELYHTRSEKEAMSIANEISERMCSQSYDHGQEWKVLSQKAIDRGDESLDSVKIEVEFRIKDTY